MCDNVDLHVFLSVGPVISGYVQLCGQRNRLCKLLSNGKYLWALKVKCVILVGLAYNICVSSYWSCCSSQKFRRSITGSLWRFCRVCCHRSKLTRVRLSTSTFTSERTSLVKWWLSSVSLGLSVNFFLLLFGDCILMSTMVCFRGLDREAIVWKGPRGTSSHQWQGDCVSYRGVCHHAARMWHGGRGARLLRNNTAWLIYIWKCSLFLQTEG